MAELLQQETLLAVGGVALFLLGMILLTEGLRQLAGPALRSLLVRVTNTPLKGAVAGAFATAVIQSSSATIVTAVGFVGAGLLSFPQGLGIVLGANVGTTATGWLVAILGFKLQLGQIALPLLLAGVLLRLFGGGRLQHVGWAVTGFSLLFVGIDAMQQGMAHLEGEVSPASFPGDTLLGRMQLVLLGVVITLITQSSSAGVAAALVALATGAMSLPQAAAMVIGMNVGTTFTAALATVGGSTSMRQTGFAHVIYNIAIGLIAFALLGPYGGLVQHWVGEGGVANAQISLVAFHTAFNLLGVVVLLPFARPFADLVVRLVPERGVHLPRRLDRALLQVPGAAVDALAATIDDIARLAIGVLLDQLALRKRGVPGRRRLVEVNLALDQAREFLDRIHTEEGQPRVHRRHLASMHALDHMLRLSHRCSQIERVQALKGDHRLRRLSTILRGVAAEMLKRDSWDAAERKLQRLFRLFDRQQQLYRELTIKASAGRGGGARDTLLKLDSIRWLRRVTYHLWRIIHHMRRAIELDGVAEAEAEPLPDAELD